jgi:hypothetical protein
MQSDQEEMRAKKKAHQKRMEALMDVSLLKTKVYQEGTELCLQKTEATIRVGQKQKGAEITTRQRRTKARNLAANQ